MKTITYSDGNYVCVLTEEDLEKLKPITDKISNINFALEKLKENRAKLFNELDEALRPHMKPVETKQTFYSKIFKI